MLWTIQHVAVAELLQRRQTYRASWARVSPADRPAFSAMASAMGAAGLGGGSAPTWAWAGPATRASVTAIGHELLSDHQRSLPLRVLHLDVPPECVFLCLYSTWQDFYLRDVHEPMPVAWRDERTRLLDGGSDELAQATLQHVRPHWVHAVTEFDGQ